MTRSRLCIRSVSRLLLVAVLMTLLTGQRVEGTEAIFLPPADMSIQPSIGPPGTAVTVSGHCPDVIYGRPVPLTVTFTDSAGHVGPTWSTTLKITATGLGEWSVNLAIPASASVGWGRFTGHQCEEGIPPVGFLVTPSPTTVPLTGPTSAPVMDHETPTREPVAPAAMPVEGHARFTG